MRFSRGRPRVRLGVAAAALSAAAATIVAPTSPALAAPATICVTAACVNANQPIYYGNADVTGQRIFRIPNTGGSPVQVTTMTDFIIAFSYDLGHSLAVLTRNRTRDTSSR